MPHIADFQQQIWYDFMRALGTLMDLLIFLPNEWTEEGIEHIVDDPKRDQQIPAEAPLELVVQLFLNLCDKINPLRDSGKHIIPSILIYPKLLTEDIFQMPSKMPYAIWLNFTSFLDITQHLISMTTMASQIAYLSLNQTFQVEH